MEKITQINIYKNVSGVYGARCNSTSKWYVGSSQNIATRVYDHRSDLKKTRHTNTHFQNAFNKYGENDWQWYVLEIVDSCDILLDREQFWMDTLKANIRDEGYNIIPTARRHKLSDETRQKMSESRKGKKKTSEHAANISSALKGHKVSQITRDKIRSKLTGKPNHNGWNHSDEAKIKMRLSWKKRKFIADDL